VHTLIYWFGFAGAWLLVSGPVFQASVELRAESEATARFGDARRGAPPPKRVSSWWWLLPPVRIVLSSRRRDDARRTFLAGLSADDLEVITRYINIARGWMLVGLGAWLIALKETYELVEHYEWPVLVYWVLVVAMSGIALGVTAVSARKEREAGHRAAG
jgi:hypothetical protein